MNILNPGQLEYLIKTTSDNLLFNLVNTGKKINSNEFEDLLYNKVIDKINREKEELRLGSTMFTEQKSETEIQLVTEEEQQDIKDKWETDIYWNAPENMTDKEKSELINTNALNEIRALEQKRKAEYEARQIANQEALDEQKRQEAESKRIERENEQRAESERIEREKAQKIFRQQEAARLAEQQEKDTMITESMGTKISSDDIKSRIRIAYNNRFGRDPSNKEIKEIYTSVNSEIKNSTLKKSTQLRNQIYDGLINTGKKPTKESIQLSFYNHYVIQEVNKLEEEE